MTDALHIPFFGYMDDYQVTEIIKLWQDLKKTYTKLTMLPFFVKAISLSLSKYPLMNVNVNPETDEQGYIKEYVIKADHNIAVAIDSPHGLMVPTIKRVQEKSIIKINDEILELWDWAYKGALTTEDFANGTFTVSSVGNLGGKYFVPTILRP